MEDSNYVGFQNYQPVTTKEILYCVIKTTSGGERKQKFMQLGMNHQFGCASTEPYCCD